MNTPGFNIRLELKFTIDRTGRKRASYWSYKAFRWLPVQTRDAERWIAAGDADLHPACAIGRELVPATGAL